MAYDKKKYYRYGGEPLIPLWVMEAIRHEATEQDLTLNQVVSRWLTAQARDHTVVGIAGKLPHLQGKKSKGD